MHVLSVLVSCGALFLCSHISWCPARTMYMYCTSMLKVGHNGVIFFWRNVFKFRYNEIKFICSEKATNSNEVFHCLKSSNALFLYIGTKWIFNLDMIQNVKFSNENTVLDLVKIENLFWTYVRIGHY